MSKSRHTELNNRQLGAPEQYVPVAIKEATPEAVNTARDFATILPNAGRNLGQQHKQNLSFIKKKASPVEVTYHKFPPVSVISF